MPSDNGRRTEMPEERLARLYAWAQQAEDELQSMLQTC